MKNILLYIIGIMTVVALIFFLLWRHERNAFIQFKEDKATEQLKSELATFKLVSEINLINERREMRDSLLVINKKNREDEKIKLLENANDSVLHAIVLDYIERPRR